MYIQHPLELASFPSLLLAMTMLRLVLNVATTRLILTNAQAGTAAAGHVVETFGNFVTAGSIAVGVIIFIILRSFSSSVITKGATRIAEVAATVHAGRHARQADGHRRRPQRRPHRRG